MSATYRFVGEAPESFPDWSGTIAVAGVVADPDAEGYVAPYQKGYQPPGELRPGQEFTGPEDLLGDVGHPRIERQAATGDWVPTVRPEAPEAEAGGIAWDEPVLWDAAVPVEPPTEPPVEPPAVTEPQPRSRGATATRSEES